MLWLETEGTVTKKRKAARRREPPSGPPTALDPTTGALKLDDHATALTPRLTRKAFLASPLGQAVRDLVVNEPWHSWELADCRIGGRMFLMGVFFEGERLTMIQLYLQEPSFSTSWEDFSPENEKVRGVAQSRWLASQLGNAGTRSPDHDERRFRWGAVGNYYDPHNMQWSIVISYGRK